MWLLLLLLLLHREERGRPELVLGRQPPLCGIEDQAGLVVVAEASAGAHVLAAKGLRRLRLRLQAAQAQTVVVTAPAGLVVDAAVVVVQVGVTAEVGVERVVGGRARVFSTACAH